MVLTAMLASLKIQGNIPDILRLLVSEPNSSNNLATKAYVSVSYIGGRCSCGGGCILTLFTLFTLLKIAMYW